MRMIRQNATRMALWFCFPLSFCVGVYAADYTWDASGGSPLNDGGGNWNPSGGTNWYDGSTYGAWGNTNADKAIFGVGNGAAGTITVGSVTANAIRFDAPGSGSYVLNGGTITLAGSTPTITVNHDAKIASNISTAGMTKDGPGTLILTGGNTALGGMTVSQGTVQVGTLSDGGLLAATDATVHIASGAVVAFTKLGNTNVYQFFEGSGNLNFLSSGASGQGNFVAMKDTNPAINYAA